MFGALTYMHARLLSVRNLVALFASTDMCCPMWTQDFLLRAVAVGTRVGLLVPGKAIGNEKVRAQTLSAVQPFAESAKLADGEKAPATTWESAAKSEWIKDEARGIACSIRHSKRVSHVAWHRKGDYFATCMSKAVTNAVLIHRMVSSTCAR